MPGYDWSFGGREPWARPRAGGYEWNRPPHESLGRARGPRDVQYGRWEGPGGYDRGLYGDVYEAYAPPPARRGPRGEPMPRGWAGYGDEYAEEWTGGYARGPFVPEHAYRRHPEMDQAPGPRGGRWGYELDDTGMELDDDQILDAVRRKLYEDVWLDVDRIDVEVEDGVVTLRGEVDDFMEVRYAWDDAWETEGVRGVVVQLNVRADEPQPDAHGDLVPQTSRGSSPEPEDASGVE